MRVSDRVFRAARALHVERRGGEVTVAEVARAAKVSWPTANRHLGGKEGLAALLAKEPVPAISADSKSRLLYAAERCAASKGIDRSTLDDVAAEAGLTKGAVYWHFESKQALITELAAVVFEGDADTWQRKLESDPAWAAAAVELWASSRDEAVRGRVIAARDQIRASLRATLGGTEHHIDLALALLDGLLVARRLEPERYRDGALSEALASLPKVSPR